ncbi:MAG: ribbon-helix-helix domain-containing protein [Candidatus Omnitrophota bacterium]
MNKNNQKTTKIDDETHRLLRILAAERGITVKAIVDEAVNDYLKRKWKRPEEDE